MENVVLEGKDAIDWVYKCEGGANLVLAYEGSSPSLVGKVLRMHKALITQCDTGDVTAILSRQDQLLWKDVEDLANSPTKEVAEQLYMHLVMIPLLGCKHLDVGMRICTSKDFIDLIKETVQPKRPAWRVKSANIDLFAQHALLISDHTLFPRGTVRGDISVSVEIKPKCGFLPSSPFIRRQNAVKMSVTRYRMHQLLKLQQKAISEVSDYDPLDMFSGSARRVRKAVADLMAVPQNNLRLFINGKQVVRRDAFDGVLAAVIPPPDRAAPSHPRAVFSELVARAVVASSVLDPLLAVQKLDVHDVEGAIHAYYDTVGLPCAACRAETVMMSSSHRLHSMEPHESAAVVRDFLIAATAKDCSLILTFALPQHRDAPPSFECLNLDSTGQSFCYKANLIDLDMKSLNKMEYYYELDQKIVRNYLKMTNGGTI